MKRNFIDRVSLSLQSGKGGNGIASFRREKFVRKGGPDGGDGGKGGDIVFNVNLNLITLNHLRYTHHLKAENGESGKGKKMKGADGKDVIIEVPPGTVIMDKEGNEIKELFEGSYVFLEGGKGGVGNVHFKSSVNQAPRKFILGKDGVSEDIVLELRLLADIGIIGNPNAGKSTLLNKITNANPEIADYPFTTLEPNLGVYDNGIRKIRIADIPGIIEGASDGKGLGPRFLKHISRVKLLLFVIDVSNPDPHKTYTALLSELEKFNRKLLRKKRMIVLNKTDLVGKKILNSIDFKNETFTFTSLKNNDLGKILEIIDGNFENEK